MSARNSIEYRDLASIGFCGYSAGSDGAIWSCKEQGGCGRITDNWRLLRTSNERSGYKSSIIYGKRIRVHRLILLAFVGPCPDGMVGCHNDGNSKNNAVSNLRWDTVAGNHQDKAKHGTVACGERSGQCKLSEKIVMKIRRQYAESNKSTGDLAAKFGIAVSYFCEIVSGRSWSHIPIIPVSDRPAYGRRGQKHHHSRLTESDVRRIRALYDSGELSVKQLAKKFNYNSGSMLLLVQRKIWKHIK